MTDQPILWRRLDRSGHESARLSFHDSSWRLAGTSVFSHDGMPCRLDYHVICNSRWQTLSGGVSGWVGKESIEIDIAVDSGRWRVNGIECVQAAGCVDLDLNFSPSTNLLPIRRLNLAIGQEAEVKAAWLRFPSFTLEPLEQIYRRIAAETYQYESAGGKFMAKLAVNAAGFVIEYPNFWVLEATS